MDTREMVVSSDELMVRWSDGGNIKRIKGTSRETRESTQGNRMEVVCSVLLVNPSKDKYFGFAGPNAVSELLKKPL